MTVDTATGREVRDAAHAHDKEWQARGVLMGVASAPKRVRNPDGAGVKTETGAFMSSPLPIAGFAIFEADDLTDAIGLASGSPCAVAHGVVEIWPLEQP